MSVSFFFERCVTIIHKKYNFSTFIPKASSIQQKMGFKNRAEIPRTLDG